MSPLTSFSFFRKSKALTALAVLCTAMELLGYTRVGMPQHGDQK